MITHRFLARPRSCKSCRQQRGFSLIELVVVIVLLSIAAVALLQQFSQASGSLIRNEELQTASQLAQLKAEELLAIRRMQGYNHAALTAGTANESLAGHYAGYTRSVTITEPAASGCPTGGTCKGVDVRVSRGATSLARIRLVLVNY